MAIKSLEKRKKQQMLLFIALGILVVTVVVLYFTVWNSSGPAPEGVIESKKSNRLAERRLEQIDLNFDFLKNKILPFVETFGNLPVEKGETGRNNPFAPY
ncbi:MAG: hypothetical protein GF387_01345 [Candidatus Portnoybacteria bacterium]|nr:hypothetical protein [Candidatus Portnoybacteria bacterium]